MVRSLSKISEEGNTVDTYRKENYIRIKYKRVLPTGGGEAKKSENMEALYSSVRSWGTEEEEDIHFQPGRDFMSTGNLFTPTHYQTTLRLYSQIL